MALTCDICGRDDFRQPAGLASHKRWQHAPDHEGSNAEALEQTLKVLDEAGRLEPIDAARVQTLRSLAQAVDDRPYSDRLWQQYREALTEVLDADGAADDGLAEALADIRAT